MSPPPSEFKEGGRTHFRLNFSAHSTFKVLHFPSLTPSTHHRTVYSPTSSILSLSSPIYTSLLALSSLFELFASSQQAVMSLAASTGYNKQIYSRQQYGFVLALSNFQLWKQSSQFSKLECLISGSREIWQFLKALRIFAGVLCRLYAFRYFPIYLSTSRRPALLPCAFLQTFKVYQIVAWERLIQHAHVIPWLLFVLISELPKVSLSQ